MESTFIIHVFLHTDYPHKALKTNPAMLINIEEADLEADPQYGELTTAG